MDRASDLVWPFFYTIFFLTTGLWFTPSCLHLCALTSPAPAIAPTLLLAYIPACVRTCACVQKRLNLELGYGVLLLSYLLYLNLNIILSALPDFGFVITFLIPCCKVQRICAYVCYLDVCMTAGIFAITSWD